MIECSSAFKKDYKNMKASPRFSKNLDLFILNILDCLSGANSLPDNYRDHALSGNWDGYRECHVKPDLLLIYKKFDHHTLRLARLGLHSELFG